MTGLRPMHRDTSASHRGYNFFDIGTYARQRCLFSRMQTGCKCVMKRSEITLNRAEDRANLPQSGCESWPTIHP
jgi:hypothetical protein